MVYVFILCTYLHWPEKDILHFSILKKCLLWKVYKKCLSLQMSTVTAKPQNYLSWSVQFVIIFSKIKNEIFNSNLNLFLMYFK